MDERSNNEGLFSDESSEDQDASPLASSIFCTSERLASKTPNPTQAGVIDIVEAASKYDIPIHFCPTPVKLGGAWSKPWTPSSGWSPTYPLGDGISCTAERYEIEQDIGPGLLKGTAVAVKKYKNRTNHGNGGETDQVSIFETIVREAEIMGSLASTLGQEYIENIAKLYFIAFAQNSAPIPIVGMELALHGTLDYVLRCPGDGLSDTDKVNITIDMTLGLDALHCIGIAHGDLKCENILICHHESRGIVAKLSDFSGSCYVDGPPGRDPSVDGRRPSHFTPLWSPPEVLLIGDNSTANIDWRKADVYAYGLLIASTWMRTSETWPYMLHPSFSTCAAEEFVPSHTIAEKERQRERDRLKLKIDEAEHSLVGQLSTFLENRLEGNSRSVVLSIIKVTLASLPADRLSIRDVLESYLSPFLASSSREDIKLPPNRSDLGEDRAPASTTTQFDHHRMSLFYFWDVCARAPSSWRKMVHKHLTEKANDIAILQEEPLGDITKSSLLDSAGTQQVLAGFQQQTRDRVLQRTQLAGDTDILDAAHCATLAGVCEMWESGHFDKSVEAIKWFRLGAICEIASGDPSADWATCLFLALLDVFAASLDSQALHQSDDLRHFPLRFCLVTQALKGSRSARRRLELMDIELADKVRQERCAVSSCGDGALQLPGTGPEYQTSMEYLRHLVQTLLVDEISKFANSCRSQDNNMDFEHQGSNILHWLVGMDLDVAPDFCTTFFNLGAKLDLAAPPKPKDGGAYLEHWGVAQLAADATPLCLAVYLGVHNVFDRLLKLHIDHDIAILNFADILQLAIVLNHPTIVDGLLRAQKSHPGLCQSELHLGSIDTALVAMVDHMTPIIRQEIHGILSPDCFKATMSVIHNSGCSLTGAIETLIDKDQPGNLELVVSVHTWTDKDMHQMLGYCIEKDARSCFRHLLSTRPHLAAARFFPSYMPLFCESATFNHGEHFLKILYQIDPEVLRTNGPGWFLPLFFALVSDQLGCAKYISETQAQTPVDKILQHSRVEQEPLETVSRIISLTLKHWLEYRSKETVELLRWILDNCSQPPPYLITRKLQLPFQNTVRARKPSPQAGRAKVLEFKSVFESVLLWSEPLFETPFMGSAVDFISFNSILRMLLDRYPQSCEHVDSLGWAPLHYAAWNGQHSTVRLLLGKGVDVNCEVKEGLPLIQTRCENLVGRTPLNLAIYALYSKAPPLIIQGGIHEVRRWRARLSAIIRALIEHGARSGVAVTTQEMAFALRFAGRIQLSLVGMGRPLDDYTDSQFFGTWPAALPNRPRPDSLAQAAFNSKHHRFKGVLGQDFFTEDYLFTTPKRQRDMYTIPQCAKWTRYALQYDFGTTHKLKVINKLLPSGWAVRLAEDGNFIYRNHGLSRASTSSPVPTHWQAEPPPGVKENFGRLYKEPPLAPGRDEDGDDLLRPMQELQLTGRNAGLPLGQHTVGSDRPMITKFSTHGDLESALDKQPLDGIEVLVSIERGLGIDCNDSESWLFPKYSSAVAEALSSI